MTAGMKLDTSINEEAQEVDLTAVKPHGDALNNGMVQISFTLPVPPGLGATEVAKQIVLKQDFKDPSAVYNKGLGIPYTYLIVYAKMPATIDYAKIYIPKVDIEVLSHEGVEEFIKENVGHDLVIVGACTGTNAHTVGIDAIMNMKGFAGHCGLEYYEGAEAINMGSQVPNEELAAKAIEVSADTILVFQVVTQKDAHIPNLAELVELIGAEGIRGKVILACGGPHVGYELVKELDYGAGFGQGTLAEDATAFVAEKVARKIRAKKGE